jgi:hypothetical protein
LKDTQVDFFKEVSELGIWSAVDGEVGWRRRVTDEFFNLLRVEAFFVGEECLFCGKPLEVERD